VSHSDHKNFFFVTSNTKWVSAWRLFFSAVNRQEPKCWRIRNDINLFYVSALC